MMVDVNITMPIISLNINESEQPKSKRLSDGIKTLNSAVYYLQETHFKYKDKSLWVTVGKRCPTLALSKETGVALVIPV